jgi:hypothetical protein
MRSLHTILILRGVMAVFVAAVAVVSFANGNVVLGALLSGLAITNVALIVHLTNRQRRVRERFPGYARPRD